MYVYYILLTITQLFGIKGTCSEGVAVWCELLEDRHAHGYHHRFLGMPKEFRWMRARVRVRVRVVAVRVRVRVRMKVRVVKARVKVSV